LLPAFHVSRRTSALKEARRQMRGLVLVLVALGVAACARGPAGPAGTTRTTIPGEGGQEIVIEGPTRGTVHHTVAGEVTDIDRNDSELTVRMPDGSRIQMKLPPFALATVRKGDHVLVDVTVTPRAARR
jgi:hypothetical protein